jgi:hypothetical protein
MTDSERRQIENFALSRPLVEIEDEDMLHFLAGLITDHDHLRAKLLTEPDKRIRREKLSAMAPYLRFPASSCDTYEIAEIARSCGAQPFYEERDRIEKSRILMPRSFVHEVRE